ncbi:transcriptional regulatory protein YedW [Candidatus Pelagibacterales bacterium]
MNNIHLSILGSAPFSSILNELEFNNILNQNNISDHSDKKILVKILFAENLKTKEVKNYLLKNEPIILFLNYKDYIKKNNLKLLDFHVSLELPIEILSFKEILNILITKYNFFKKSKIVINDYEIDSNERSITKQKIKVKLTEKELELILALNNNNNGLNKSFLLKSIWKHSLDLETHAFETHLHRLRKKMNKYFNDKNFIVERNSQYFLTN